MLITASAVMLTNVACKLTKIILLQSVSTDNTIHILHSVLKLTQNEITDE